MIYLTIVAGLFAYSAVCYLLMYRSVKRSPGPYGVGWLILPLAPLMLPLLIIDGIKSFFRKVFS